MPGHDDLTVSATRDPNYVKVECVCLNWRRTISSGHTLTELTSFLGQHQQAAAEEEAAAKRRKELWG